MGKIELKKTLNIIAVVALLIFLHFTNILQPAENAIIFVLNPIGSKLYSFSSSIRSYYNQSKENKNLVNEVDILEKEINKILSENARLKLLEKENKSLREYLSFFDNHNYNFKLANIISYGDINSAEQKRTIFVIDKGANDGISVGFPVVDENGVIVGKISKVEDKISEVSLTTNPFCKLAATTNKIDQARGLTEGNLGLTINMNYISQEDNIEVNDIVITSGLDEKVPAGLLIGRVIKVERKSNDVWQSAVIEPLVDAENLNIVSVIIP